VRSRASRSRARRATSPAAAAGGEGAKGVGNGAIGGRTDEEIQIVFDRHKSELYRLYNRELRRDPSLRGQMILRLTIEPDGSVSCARCKGSDMNAPQLAQQVVDRVETFDFGAKRTSARSRFCIRSISCRCLTIHGSGVSQYVSHVTGGEHGSAVFLGMT
jgi:hypothetical protein